MTHDLPPKQWTVGNTPLDRRGSSRVDDVHFTAGDGTRWRVGERIDVEGSERRASLVFECSDSARRVREYPENWRDLSHQELESLSWAT